MTVAFSILIWALFTAALLSVCVTMEIALRGESATLDALRSFSPAVFRVMVLRPFISPTSASIILILAAMGVVLLSASMASLLPRDTLALFHRSTGSVPIVDTSWLRWLRQWLPPIVAACLLAYLFVWAAANRGVLQLSAFARRIRLMIVTFFFANLVLTVLAPVRQLAAFSTIGIAVAFFVAAYAWKWREEYLARVSWDTDSLVTDVTTRLLWWFAQRGFVPIIYAISNVVLRSPQSKDGFKLVTVLAYHMQRYEKARQRAEEGIAYCRRNGENSEILTSYLCLAMARLGQLRLALDHMAEAIAGTPDNYYYRSVYAYLLWSHSEIGQATEEAALALAQYKADPKNVQAGHVICYSTAVQYSLFLCEGVVDDVARGLPISRQVVSRAILVALQAGQRVNRRQRFLSWGDGRGGLLHNLAFACVLLSETEPPAARDELLRFALGVFARNVGFEAHLASRFRIALFHMVASRQYVSAEYQLNRIHWDLRMQPERLRMRFGRLVELNQERVAAARRQDVVFNRRILTLYASEDLIPQDALMSLADRAAERRIVASWFEFGLRDLMCDPLGRLPRAVQEIGADATAMPWDEARRATS